MDPLYEEICLYINYLLEGGYRKYNYEEYEDNFQRLIKEFKKIVEIYDLKEYISDKSLNSEKIPIYNYKLAWFLFRAIECNYFIHDKVKFIDLLKKILNNNFNNIKYHLTIFLIHYDEPSYDSCNWNYHFIERYNLFYYLACINPYTYNYDFYFKYKYDDGKYVISWDKDDDIFYESPAYLAELYYENIMEARYTLQFAWIGACIRADVKE